MATLAQLRDRAANNLGILALNSTLQDQDKVRLENAYSEVYQRLKKDGYAIWTSTADIPTYLVEDVAMLVARNCINTYPTSTERYQRIVLGAAEAEINIAKYTADDYSSQDEATDF